MAVQLEHKLDIHALNEAVIKSYPGIVYICCYTSVGKKYYGLTYQRNGLLVAGPADKSATKWGIYSGLEDFYSEVIGSRPWFICCNDELNLYGLSIQERVENFNSIFQGDLPLCVANHWIYGIWIVVNRIDWRCGQSYLNRVMTLFPDVKDALFLFFKFLPTHIKGKRFDSDGDADFVGNICNLAKIVNKEFDFILFDSLAAEESLGYEFLTANRPVIMQECVQVLKPGGYIVWIDRMSLPYPEEVEQIGLIGLAVRGDHQYRNLSIFEKPIGRLGGEKICEA